MTAGTYRLPCGGCKKVLKLELSDVPDQDFSINCPKCKAAVFVRAAAVKAASMRPTANPTEGFGQWTPAGGAPPPAQAPSAEPSIPSETRRAAVLPASNPQETRRGSAPSETARSTKVPVPDFAVPDSAFQPGVEAPLELDLGTPAAKDMTDSVLQMNDSAERESRPLPPPPAMELPEEAPRAPTNAPRTQPRPPGASAPPWKLIAVGGGSVGGLVLLVVIALLVKSAFGGGPSATPTPSTVESDSSVRKDLAELKARYPDPGGTAADLYAQGMKQLAGDTSAEHRQAAETLRRAAAADIKDPRALAGVAIASLLLPRSEREGMGVAQANQWADYAQRMKPDAPIGAISRAMLLSSLGRDADARTLAAEAATKAPKDDPWVPFAEGWVWRKDDPAKAAAAFQRSVDADGDFRLARTELAAALVASGRLHAATAVLDARAAAGTTSGEAEGIAARIADRVGDDGVAKKHYAQSIALEPKDPATRIAYATFLLRIGDAAAAREVAKPIIETEHVAQDASDAQAGEATLITARAARLEKKRGEAVTIAREALKLYPNRPVALHELGLALMAGDQPIDAGDPLVEAAQKAPSSAPIQVTLAFAQLKAGRLGEAIQAFQAALALDPDLGIAHVGLAEAFSEAEFTSQPLDELAKLIETTHPMAPMLRRGDPDHPLPPLDTDHSLAWLKKLEANDPNRDVRYRVYEGAILCLGGRVNDGIIKMTSARPTEPATQAYIAGWQLAAGRASDALRTLPRAETARELTTRGWALRTAKSAGDDTAFVAALALDVKDPYANLGHALGLISKGKKPEAGRHLDAAETRLKGSPALAKARMALEP